MLIQESIVSISFPIIENIRRAYFDNGSILIEDFDEPNVLGIPDDAPSDIPRLVFKSKNQFSELSISQTSISMRTHFSDDFMRDWELCGGYLEKKCSKVVELADKLTSGSYNYVGLVVNILFDSFENETNCDGTCILSNNLSKLESSKDVFDINMRYTFTENNKYFVNFDLRNVRLYKEIGDPNMSGAFKKDNEELNAVGVVIDINDRYKFNNEENYNSNASSFTEALELLKGIIDDKLSLLVEKGEYL